MQQPKGAETGQGVAQAGEPGEKLRIGDRQQASDQRKQDEYRREVCRKETLTAKNMWGRQAWALLGEQKRQQARIIKETPYDIKMVEDQNSEGGKGNAGDGQREATGYYGVAIV